MSAVIRAAGLVLLGWLVSVAALAGPSVGWRNDGTGQFPGATPPAEWSKEKNVAWKVAMPGNSYGTPIVVGDHLFVVSDPSELLCIRRSDGKVLWKKSHGDIKAPAVSSRGGRGGFGGRGRPGGFGGRGMGGRGMGAGNTAATPASDGKHVAALFANGVAAVYDLDGKRLWGKFIESPQLMFGHAASPLLVQDRLIVHFRDLVALEAATGKEAWRVKLPASHASPVSARLGKEDVVISPAGAIVRVRDGKVLCKSKFRTTQASPVLSGNILCVFGRDSTEALELTTSENGEVKVKSLWSNDGFGERHQLPSPLIHDGLLYGVSTAGFLEVRDVKTGKRIYRQRLGMNGQVYSSLSLAGGLLYLSDLRGKTVVFRPGRKFERVATNQLEGTGSCPVFAGDHLYLRGRSNLYCLSSKETKAPEKEAKKKE